MSVVDALGQIRPDVEADLSRITADDLLGFALVGVVAIVGVWIMTLPSRLDSDEPEDEEPACALCGREAMLGRGAVFPGPRSRKALGIGLGEPVCPSCVRRLSR
jgi:hypothetical protein